MTATILLIDDKDEYVSPLRDALQLRLGDMGHVVSWVPNRQDLPLEKFQALVDEHDVRLVVTDYDLTEGQLGFFGSTVVDWCQKHTIPVGDFSRGHASSLAQEPNMFELRVPISPIEGAIEYIAEVFLGFKTIRSKIDETPELLNKRSPAAVIAAILEQPRLASQFGQYGIRYGGANSALFDSVMETASPNVKPSATHVAALLTYITGHLLVNAILRFPGPIMDEETLCAYLAVDCAEESEFQGFFDEAIYQGPFSALKQFRWTHVVDELLAKFDDKVDENAEFNSTGALNRHRLEIALGRTFTRSNTCNRCHGEDGGFYCPFTKRTVCQKPDCSVVSNAWIPAGARLARFEKEFYDEWSPILGM